MPGGRIIAMGFEGENDISAALLEKNASGETLVNSERCDIAFYTPGKRPVGAVVSPKHFHICLGDVHGETGPGFFVSTGDGGALLKTDSAEGQPYGLELVSEGLIAVSDTAEFLFPIRTGVLTVSDKGSRGERKDLSGPALEESVISIGAEICYRDMVPDDQEMIRAAILGWVGENGLDLILVTGGTGLSERDVTPEALRGLGGREASGFGEYIRSATWHFNPRAILSRSTAVVFERCLVLALPGSPRGAVECLEAVKPVLRHAIEIASGRGGECGHAHSH